MNEKEPNESILRIKKRRLELGLSYQQLADRTGINKSTLQRYETGAIKNLSFGNLEIIASGLDTTPEYVMGFKEQPHNSAFGIEKITSPLEAMTFLLKQPSIIAYGGYDVEKMTSDDLVDFSNELLRQFKLVSYKYKYIYK